MRPLFVRSMAVVAGVIVAALLGGGSAMGSSADLGISMTANVASAVPGQDHPVYTITVTNTGTSNVKGAIVSDPAPLTNATWTCVPGSGATCVASGNGSISQSVNLQGGASAVFTITGGIAPSAIGSLVNTATIATPKGSPDPTPADNTATQNITMTPVADLSLDSASVSPLQIFANTTVSQNTTVYSVSFSNSGGPSDAHDATLSFSPVLNALIGSAEWCQIIVNVACTQDSQFTAYNSSTGIDVGELAPGAGASLVIRAHASAGDRDGARHVAQAFVLSMPAPTTDPNSNNNTASTSSVEIDTVPTPPQNVQAVPGNGNVILTWEAPAGDGGQSPIDQYAVTVNGSNTPIIVPASSPQVTCPDGTANDCYRLNVSPLANDSPDTFNVQAHNAVGYSDPTTVVQTPSKNASSQIVSAGTTTVFSTCTTATSTQQTCVQLQVPSGVGGVFGAGNGDVYAPTPPNLCGPAGCVANTGAQSTGPLTGYNDPTHPIIEVVTWDSTTIPSTLPLNPVCSTNTTLTNCFPNNLPQFYEMSHTLQLDPTGLLATQLNVTGTFCRDPIVTDGSSAGGAGNVAFARPNPGLPNPQFSGYFNSAGSACISSVSVLTGLPGRPNQKGDVQSVINLTSDSDAILGHR